MSQISRPFQIALAAFVVIFALWFVVLRGHSSTGHSSPSAASSSAQPAATPQASSSSASSGSSGSSAPGTSTYHGSAPGVAGLTRAISKAQGAVAQSTQEAKSQPGSGNHSGSTAAATSAGATHARKSSSAAAGHPSAIAPTATAAPSGAAQAKAKVKAAGAPAQEAAVQSELKAGRTVIILFWSPQGSDDRAVHSELRALQSFHEKFGTKANKEIAVHYAHASEVGQFGAITRSLQILQTPTTLIITPSGNAKTLTGLVDAYTIQQAILEVRKA